MNKDAATAEFKKQFPLFFLEMNEMQRKFIRLKNRKGETPKRRFAESGNKAGKTEIGIAEDLAHAFGCRIWLPEDDPDYRIDIRVPNMGVIGCETMAHSVPEKIWPTLKKLLPKTCNWTKKNSQAGVPQKLTIHTGGEPQAAAPAPEPAEQKYTVQRGDFLGKIADQYGVTVQQLMEWNNLSGIDIQVGQVLVIRK